MMHRKGTLRHKASKLTLFRKVLEGLYSYLSKTKSLALKWGSGERTPSLHTFLLLMAGVSPWAGQVAPKFWVRVTNCV